MKRMFFFMVSLMLILVNVIAQKNTGTIKGTITTSDGVVTPGVTVQLKNGNKGAVSNSKGTFEFGKLTPGDYQLLVSLIGYKTSQQNITVTAGEAATPNIQLDASDAQLREIVISSERQRYQVNALSPTLRLTTPLLQTPQNIQVVTSKLLADQQIFDMLEGVTRNVSGATKKLSLEPPVLYTWYIANKAFSGILLKALFCNLL